MSQGPRFPDMVVGLNDFTAEVFNRMADLLEEFDRWRPFLEQLKQEHDGVRPRRLFPAIITGYSRVSDNRWKYAWAEAQFTNSTNWGVRTGGLSSYAYTETEWTAPAYNRLERSNTSSGVVSGGINLASSSYPAGFCPRPVLPNDATIYTCAGGANPLPPELVWGASGGPCVLMHIERGAQSEIVYGFDWATQHDGDCT